MVNHKALVASASLFVAALALPAAQVATGVDLVARNAPDGSLAVAHSPEGLEKRLSSSFSLAHSWDNQLLFAGTVPNGIGGTATLSVRCNTCYTKGTVAASITNSQPLADPTVRLDFSGVEAYVDLAVVVSESTVYTINLFTSNTPLGTNAGGLDVGLVFAVDLVFSLSDEIDIDAGGFVVTLADGSYVEASLMEGTITSSLFDGIAAHSLPVSVTSGTATFKADLRLRTQCGVEGTSLVGIGAGLELGIYTNIIEFVSILETTHACGLQSREFWDLNVGAFALADVEVDYQTFGAVPTASQTLLTAPTATQCWKSIVSAVESAIGDHSTSVATSSKMAISASVTPSSTPGPVSRTAESTSATASSFYSVSNKAIASSSATPLSSYGSGNKAAGSASLMTSSSYGPINNTVTFSSAVPSSLSASGNRTAGSVSVTASTLHSPVSSGFASSSFASSGSQAPSSSDAYKFKNSSSVATSSYASSSIASTSATPSSAASSLSASSSIASSLSASSSIASSLAASSSVSASSNAPSSLASSSIAPSLVASTSRVSSSIASSSSGSSSAVSSSAHFSFSNTTFSTTVATSSTILPPSYSSNGVSSAAATTCTSGSDSVSLVTLPTATHTEMFASHGSHGGSKSTMAGTQPATAVKSSATDSTVLVPSKSSFVKTATPSTALPTPGKDNGSGSNGSGSNDSGSNGSGSNGSGSNGSGSSGSSGSSNDNDNGNGSGSGSPPGSSALGGPYSPPAAGSNGATAIGAGSSTVVTAGANISMSGSSLAAVVGVFAAAVLF